MTDPAHAVGAALVRRARPDPADQGRPAARSMIVIALTADDTDAMPRVVAGDLAQTSRRV